MEIKNKRIIIINYNNNNIEEIHKEKIKKINSYQINNTCENNPEDTKDDEKTTTLYQENKYTYIDNNNDKSIHFEKNLHSLVFGFRK